MCRRAAQTHFGSSYADTVNSKWGKDTTDPAVVLSMPPMRQTLFRGVWAEGSNKFYDSVSTN